MKDWIGEARSRLKSNGPTAAKPETNGHAAHMPWETKPSGELSDTGIQAADLALLEMAPPKFAISDLLCEGLTVLGGRPKMGKSWLALLIGWAVATNNDLDGRGVNGGSVLYLSLEDTRRRLKSRLEMLRSALGWEVPRSMKIHTSFPRADQGGLYHVAEWLAAEKENARLVIIDTIAKFRKPAKGNGNSYQDDYGAFGDIKHLADQFGAAAIAVHHTRKQTSEDPFEELSGTSAIAAAADGLMVIDRRRGADEGRLYITGRDVSDLTIPLKLDRQSFRWHLGKAVEGIDTTGRHVSQADNRVEACMSWLREFLARFAYPSAEISAAAKAAGFSFDALKQAKARLGRDGTGELVNRNYGVGPGKNDWWSGLGQFENWTKRPETGPPVHRSTGPDSTGWTGGNESAGPDMFEIPP